MSIDVEQILELHETMSQFEEIVLSFLKKTRRGYQLGEMALLFFSEKKDVAAALSLMAMPIQHLQKLGHVVKVYDPETISEYFYARGIL